MPFLAYEAALAAIRCVRPLLPRIAARDASLASQLSEAASSCALNLGEGRYRRGRDRTYHYRVGASSGNEAKSALEVAVAWGHLTEADIADAHAAYDRVLQLTWPLVR